MKRIYDHVALLAWISLTLSHHSSLSSIASGRSSRLHPERVEISWSANICMFVWRGAFEKVAYEFVLLQQRPACLVRLIWMVLEMGGRWPYSCCFVGCCFQDLFNIAFSILVQFPSSFFSLRLVSIHMVHPYSWIDTTAAWKKLRLILSNRSYFHMIDNLSIAFHAFASHILMAFSVDVTLLPRLVNLSTSFKEPPYSVEMSPFFY